MKKIASVLLASVLLSVTLLAEKKHHSADQRSGLAEKWVAAWNSHDPDKIVAVFTNDVLYEDVPYGEVNHGSAELRKFAASELEAVPDLKVELAESSIQGGSGSFQWIFSGTDKGIYKTGKPFKVRGVSIIKIENGKISRNIDYYDAATIMRDVGVLPPAAKE